MVKTKYKIQVKLSREGLPFPWVDMAVGKFDSMTAASIEMLDLQDMTTRCQDIEFRIVPVNGKD